MRIQTKLSKQEVGNLVVNYLVSKGLKPIAGTETPVFVNNDDYETYTFEGYSVDMEGTND